jgi:hypothetical protein
LGQDGARKDQPTERDTVITIEFTLESIEWTDSYEDPYRVTDEFRSVWVADYSSAEEFWQDLKAYETAMVLTSSLGAFDTYYTSADRQLRTARVTAMTNAGA